MRKTAEILFWALAVGCATNPLAASPPKDTLKVLIGRFQPNGEEYPQLSGGGAIFLATALAQYQNERYAIREVARGESYTRLMEEIATTEKNHAPAVVKHQGDMKGTGAQYYISVMYIVTNRPAQLATVAATIYKVDDGISVTSQTDYVSLDDMDLSGLGAKLGDDLMKATGQQIAAPRYELSFCTPQVQVVSDIEQTDRDQIAAMVLGQMRAGLNRRKPRGLQSIRADVQACSGSEPASQPGTAVVRYLVFTSIIFKRDRTVVITIIVRNGARLIAETPASCAAQEIIVGDRMNPMINDIRRQMSQNPGDEN